MAQPNQSRGWDEAQKRRLSELWFEGGHRDAIADVLNEEFGTERSGAAVAIQATRMSLPARPDQRPQAKSPTRALACESAAGGSDATGDLMERDEVDHLPARVPPTPKIRKCLMCTKEFYSEGAHNRVCGSCRESDVWRYA